MQNENAGLGVAPITSLPPSSSSVSSLHNAKKARPIAPPLNKYASSSISISIGSNSVASPRPPPISELFKTLIEEYRALRYLEKETGVHSHEMFSMETKYADDKARLEKTMESIPLDAHTRNLYLLAREELESTEKYTLFQKYRELSETLALTPPHHVQQRLHLLMTMHDLGYRLSKQYCSSPFDVVAASSSSSSSNASVYEKPAKGQRTTRQAIISTLLRNTILQTAAVMSSK